MVEVVVMGVMVLVMDKLLEWMTVARAPDRDGLACGRRCRS
jgi:hypothetical protein